eukprot:SAG31_NODE_20322_length_577_cov_1.715481_1_plen_70_part_10
MFVLTSKKLSTELPWSLPEYEGPKQQSFDVSNATAAVDSHFNLQIHEAYGEKEVTDSSHLDLFCHRTVQN